jgi:pantetheine-phosphate adenylyltransferase
VRIAVYAGSFDPVTNGHLAIVHKALALVDQLHVLVAVNPGKQPWFSAAERVELLRAVLPAGVQVASTAGYVVDYARQVEARWLIRGVRDGADATSELQLAALNTSLAPDVSTWFVPADPTTFEISSSRLKALCAAGQPLEALCPAVVAQALRRRCAPRAQAAARATVGD